VVLSTKFGFIFDDDGNRVGIDGSPAYMRKAIEASLRRLQTDYVDVYFLHRVDPDVPVEESVGAMSELVTEGKVRAIGLSEAGPESLRRAHEVHPISVMENEYSLWTRAAEDIQPMLRERGIALVAYSPLGRGFLAGRIRSPDDLAVSDIRRTRFPRFDQQNLAKNVIWLERLEAIAREKNCTLSQLALAWVLSKGPDVIPIPGTKRIKYLEENAAAVHLDLGPDDLALLEHVVDAKAVAGDQKDASGMRAMGH
jgi:aryl-alcohol dehydrogenase-like predicted oxidoreductase